MEQKSHEKTVFISELSVFVNRKNTFYQSNLRRNKERYFVKKGQKGVPK